MFTRKRFFRLVFLFVSLILISANIANPAVADKADDSLFSLGLNFSGESQLASKLSIPSNSSWISSPTTLKPVVIQAEHADVSPPLSSIEYELESPGDEILVMPDLNPPQSVNPDVPFSIDPVVQEFFGDGSIPPTTVNFEAINNLCSCLPPDTVGDVGPNHYVQMVNVHYAVYDKTGTLLLGPAPINSIWSGFGGVCEADNSGDPIVLYDHLADRWILTQFAVTTGQHECIAVSTSPDPTGTYNRYAFNIGGFPDYPKLGVWVDSYLATFRNFGAAFDMQGAGFNRAKMLAGDPTAEMVLFSMSAAFSPLGIDGFLPADLDGPGPAAGTDAPFMGLLPDENGFPQDALAMFELDVDWTNPGAAVVNGPTIIPVDPFAYNMCDGARDCIPQPDTAQGLDAIADRILHRLAYRDFGFYQAMVAVHTVNAGTAMDEKAGERWYELRNSTGTWGVYQQGTYAPDDDHRWMGSIAMDGAGNIAMGYSVSSSTVYPSIRYTGRLVTDPLGTMPQGEGEVIAGTGSQTHSAARWGDYSAMVVDPADDCTFWYTTEYIETTGSAPWQTRVGAFAFPDCPAPASDDFSIWAQPVEQDVCSPNEVAYDVTAFQIGSYGQNVSLSAVGVPSGYSASFGTNPVIPAATTVMTLTNTGAATGGQYDIDVVGMGPTQTHTSTVTLNLYTAAPVSPTPVSPADGAINQAVRPVLTWNSDPNAIQYTVEVASDAGFSNIVDTGTVTSNSYQVSINLDLNTTYYWRVKAGNTCGDGSYSTAFSFTVVGDGASCPAGMAVLYSYVEDFESGEAGWTHSAATGPDTWALQNSNPGPGSGGFNFHANDHTSPSDQRLVSPAIDLPSGATQLTLQFQNYQFFENPAGSGGCWDGGTLEVSDDGGSSWTTLDAELLSDPYDGYGNNGPPAGKHMWCGESGGFQPWLNSIVDLSAYDGQTVQFRFSQLSDAAAGAPGWNIDDVKIASCYPATYLPLVTRNTETGIPDIDVTPSSLSSSQEVNTVVTKTLTINNTGTANLNWNIDEEPAAPISADLPVGSARGRMSVKASGSAPQALYPIGPSFVQGGISEGFEDITLLPGAGWAMINNSDPLGVTSWFQGNDGVFPAQAGTSISYIGANFNNTAGGTGVISNWLLTPEVTLENGAELTFWTRTPSGSLWPDRLEVRMSTNGSSTNVGGTSTSVGDFTTLLTSVNASLSVGGYPEVWTEYTVTVSGLGSPTTGRFGFRYFVTDAGPTGTNSNYIGIDTVDYVTGGGPVCSSPSNVTWLSVSPASGSTAAAGSDDVTVTFDSNSLGDGSYSANLCISSNDPDEDLVTVPVDMSVTTPPNIDVDPISLDSTQAAGNVVTQTLTIANTGGSSLNWNIDEDNTISSLSARPAPANGTITIGDAGFTGSGLSPDAVSTGDTPLLSPAGSITLTHSSSNTVVPGSVACNYNAPPNGASDNAYLRVFDLSTYPAITGNFNVTNVQFGVENAVSVGGTQPLTINLYRTLSEPLLYANMTLIGTANINLSDQSLTLVNIPVTGTAFQSDLLVVEIYQPDTGNTATNFFFGSNAQPQTDESYLASVGCGLNNPTNIAAIGFPDMHIIMSVSGDVSAQPACDAVSDIPWLSLSPTNGSIVGASSDDVTVTFDSNGLTSGMYDAAMCVNSNDPDDPLVVVPVTLTIP